VGIICGKVEICCCLSTQAPICQVIQKTNTNGKTGSFPQKQTNLWKTLKTCGKRQTCEKLREM